MRPAVVADLSGSGLEPNEIRSGSRLFAELEERRPRAGGAQHVDELRRPAGRAVVERERDIRAPSAAAVDGIAGRNEAPDLGARGKTLSREAECRRRSGCHGEEGREQKGSASRHLTSSFSSSRYRSTATVRSASATAYSRARRPISSKSYSPSCARRIAAARSSGWPGGTTTPQPTRPTSSAVSLSASEAGIPGRPSASQP